MTEKHEDREDPACFSQHQPGDLEEKRPMKFLPAAGEAGDLINKRLFATWNSNVDARVMQVALALTPSEYKTWAYDGMLPEDYLTRKIPRGYKECAGIGQLLGDLRPALDKPFTVDSLVAQYEERAKLIHKCLGWDVAQWRGLAELWAVTDLEILRMAEGAQPQLSQAEVAEKLFKAFPEERSHYAWMPELVDRYPGTPPIYRGYPFERPEDARYLTAHREPVRPMDLDFDYILDTHTINVRSGTPCAEDCAVCRNEALNCHQNSLYQEESKTTAKR